MIDLDHPAVQSALRRAKALSRRVPAAYRDEAFAAMQFAAYSAACAWEGSEEGLAKYLQATVRNTWKNALRGHGPTGEKIHPIPQTVRLDSAGATVEMEFPDPPHACGFYCSVSGDRLVGLPSRRRERAHLLLLRLSQSAPEIRQVAALKLQGYSVRQLLKPEIRSRIGLDMTTGQVISAAKRLSTLVD